MDILRARVVFRERRLSDVVDLSLRFFVAQWRPYLSLSAVVIAPLLLVTLLLDHELPPAAVWSLALAAMVLAEGPFTMLASRLVFADEVPLRPLLRDALRMLPRLAFTRLFQGIGLVCAMFFFVIPAAWVATTWCFLSEVTLLERPTFGAAYGRASRLVERMSGDVFLLVLASVGLFFAVIVLADSAGSAVMREVLQITPPASLFEKGGSGTLSLVAAWLYIPLHTTIRFFTYLDLRARKEGWDIQTRFASIATRESAEASS